MQYTNYNFHAKILVIGYWTSFYVLEAWFLGIFRNLLRGMWVISFFVPLNFVILFYAYFMLKGVSIRYDYLITKD